MDDPVLDTTQSDFEFSRAGLFTTDLPGDTGPRVTIIEILERLERLREKSRRRRRRQQLNRIGRRRRRKIAR
jgi:hypothetical protein